MAKVLAIVLMCVIAFTVAVTANICKSCEICVQANPLGPNGCTMPSPLPTATYDSCSAVMPCPCITDISSVTAVDIQTGLEQIVAMGPDGKVIGLSGPDPVALVANDDGRIQAIIQLTPSTYSIACDPVGIKDASNQVTTIKGSCKGTTFAIPAGLIAGDTGKVTRYLAGTIRSLTAYNDLFLGIYGPTS